MSARLEPFLNNSIYHVFNKTIDFRKIFANSEYANLFLSVMKYYRSAKEKPSYSCLSKLSKDLQKIIAEYTSRQKYFRVSILAFCLMPTHFHILIKQKKENGISRFISDIINSLTRYFNLKNERKGPVILSRFKSVRIVTDEQLMHVSRYIHLNPYSCNIVNNITELNQYPWSSYKMYLSAKNTTDDLVDTKDILGLFDSNREKYKNFVLSNADYQQTLEMVKYSAKW